MQPIVLLLHGYTDSADTWRAVLSLLAAQGVTAVAVDLPLHGHATGPERPGLGHFEDFVAAAIRYYDAGEGVWLVGNSLGGLLAARVAARPGLPVRGVVTLGAPDGSLHPLLGTLPLTQHALRVLLHLPVPSGVLSGAAAFGYNRLACGGSLDPHAAAFYRVHLDRRRMRKLVRAGGTVVAQLRRVGTAPNLQPGVTVTQLWGERDLICPPSAARRHTSQVVPHMAHCPQIQVPAWCANRVMSMLRESAAETHHEMRRIG
ncbi:MAG: alpha/beta fold hydrolase [Propionibacteriales bacterium]|nr:alpha/beta fold hydrolase [Propionibacteriales bacterium]